MSAEDKITKLTQDDLAPITYNETSITVNEQGSTQVVTSEENGLRPKAAHAVYAVADLTVSAVKHAIHSVKSKAREFYTTSAFQPGFAAERRGSVDIARLGPLITILETDFERMETIVSEQSYQEQVRLLTGYKKLLEEQINVLDSRTQFAKRL